MQKYVHIIYSLNCIILEFLILSWNNEVYKFINTGRKENKVGQ